eukprot:674272-Amphidinium_carterae.1
MLRLRGLNWVVPLRPPQTSGAACWIGDPIVPRGPLEALYRLKQWQLRLALTAPSSWRLTSA